MAAARRAGTGRRPHAPCERLRLHRHSAARRPEGAALIMYGGYLPRGLRARPPAPPAAVSGARQRVMVWS
jgi:hypothetical protein